MARIGRNDPCPCGSGRKAKRCCPIPRGPSADDLARVFLDHQARRWAPVLADHTSAELNALREEVAALPARDLSLHLRLPRLLPPALERLRRVVAADDGDSLEVPLREALELVDTPPTRERLARTIIERHQQESIAAEGAAYAVVDLATAEDRHPVVLVGALYHTLAVATGARDTPSGLVVAAR